MTQTPNYYAYVSQTNAAAEWSIRSVIGGARINLERAGARHQYWSHAARHACLVNNIIYTGEGSSPWFQRLARNSKVRWFTSLSGEQLASFRAVLRPLFFWGGYVARAAGQADGALTPHSWATCRSGTSIVGWAVQLKVQSPAKFEADREGFEEEEALERPSCKEI